MCRCLGTSNWIWLVEDSPGAEMWRLAWMIDDWRLGGKCKKLLFAPNRWKIDLTLILCRGFSLAHLVFHELCHWILLEFPARCPHAISVR